MDAADEQRLLIAAAAGDETAFRHIAAYHRPGLERFCVLMLGCPLRGREAVCEALLRGWQTVDGISSSTPARIWLYRLAMNVCIEDLDATDEFRGRRPFDGARDMIESQP